MKITVYYPDKNEKTLTDYLSENLYIPRKVKHFLRMRKDVLVNKNKVPFNIILQYNDEITINFNDEDYQQPKVLCSSNCSVDVLYEDNHLIIVDKPIKIKTHPNEPTENDTLLNYVAAYLDNKKQIPYVVHRLDKETSGCVLFAKNPVILPIVSRMLENKEIRRSYEAIALGNISSNKLRIDKPIGRDMKDKRKRRIDLKNGKKAITNIKVLSNMNDSTRIECQLETGRTHQIRVHLASINHPLKGDPLYQNQKDNRLYLHAKQIEFKHPFTNERITIQSKVPF